MMTTPSLYFAATILVLIQLAASTTVPTSAATASSSPSNFFAGWSNHQLLMAFLLAVELTGLVAVSAVLGMSVAKYVRLGKSAPENGFL